MPARADTLAPTIYPPTPPTVTTPCDPGTLEFQIEHTARKKLTRLKKSTRMIFFDLFSLQNARYQLPLCLDLNAVTMAQKLMPF